MLKLTTLVNKDFGTWDIYAGSYVILSLESKNNLHFTQSI